MNTIEFASRSEWYATKRMDSDVTLIHEPWIKPFYRCNIWLIKGRDRDLLVDSGMGVVPLRENIPALTGRPILAVASHSHFDHIGAHHEFEECAIHENEAEILRSPDNVSTAADIYARTEIFNKLPPGWKENAYHVNPARATIKLRDGDLLDLGDRNFEVIHLPGHSPGSIALWEKQTGMLFSGDTVYDGPLVDDAHNSDIDLYVKSMERLRELPVTVVHGGHFPSFGGETFRQLIDDFVAEKSG